MEQLFSYGTLQLEQVQQQTFGRILQGTPAVLIGYILSEVTITDQEVIRTSGKDIHPILKKTGIATDHVQGTIFDITVDELMHADAYEVDDYMRVQGHFTTNVTAWIYAERVD